MKRHIAIVAALLLAAAMPAKAQYDETNNLFYHTMRTPQSNMLNPAFYPTNNTFYFMLPGVDMQFGSPMALSDVVRYDRQQQLTVIDLNQMLTTLNVENKFRVGANVSVFGFGLKVHNTFVNFSTRLMNNVSLGLPISTINALLQGNTDANDQPIAEVRLMDGDLLNAQSYLETSIGVGHKFKSLGLTVGAHAKLLYGVANVQTDNTRITLETKDGYDQMVARMYYEVQMATCVPLDTSTKEFNVNVKDLLTFSKANTGVSFDLGARWDYGPFIFSFAINDLSAGIHWKNNVRAMMPENGQGVIEFTGMDLNNLIDHGQMNTDSLTNYLRERIEGMMPKAVDSAASYWFSIPTKINLGASFNFAKMFRAGLLFHGQFDRGLLSKSNAVQFDLGDNVTNTFRWNTTLSCGLNFKNWVELIVASSAIYDGSSLDLFNPGAGLVFTPGTFFQVYVMTDYISSMYLTDSKAFNLKVGLNLLFGKGGRRTILSVD